MGRHWRVRPNLEPLDLAVLDNTPQIASQAPRRRDGRRSRDKGNRAEREIIVRHPELGIHAERYPLSGTSRFRR